ncbi:MAG: hypothetical protein NVS2B16_11050 [Chloroflexota bacterium]
MDDELVLLTSYFNLADARRQDSADTFRVDPSVASSTSPDGTAALYIVTESSASGNMGPRARRVAADTVAWEYATHSDEPPASRLKAALRAAHEGVVHEFDGHVTVGLSVVAVEGDTVYLGQVAPAQVYVLHEGSLHSIAAGIEGSAPFARALGSRSGPRISVFRDQVGPDDVLALCSSWYHRGADAADLRECFAQGSADDIAESLLDLAKQHDTRDVTAIVIEAVLARDLEEEDAEDAPPSFREQVDTAVEALTGIGKMLWDELRYVPEEVDGNGAHARHDDREAVAARPVAHPAPAEDEQRDEAPQDWSGHARDMTHEVPAIDSESPPQDTGVYYVDSSPVREGLTHEVPLIPADDSAPEPHATSANGAGRKPADEEHGWAHDSDRVDREPADPYGVEPDPGQASDRTQTSSIPHIEAATVPDTLPANPEPADSEPSTEQPRWRRPRRARPVMRSQPQPDPEPDPPTQSASQSASELEQVNSRIQNDPDLGDVIPPVQAFADTSTTEPSRIYATSKDIRAVNKHRPRRFSGARGSIDGLGGPTVIRPGDKDIDLRRPMPRSTPPALIWASAVVLIVFAALGIYLYMHRSHGTVAVVNPYPALARADITRAAAAKSPAEQDAWLGKAQTRIRQARRFGHVKAATLATLRSSLQTTSDRLHHLTRIYTASVVTDFTQIPGANPSQIAALPGQVFVLDQARKSVFAVSTNGGSTSGPSEVTRSGEIVSTITIGNPLLLTADTRTPGTMVILDDKNQVIRYSGNAKTATPLTQPSQAALHPVGIATSDPDLYLLDPANNQVWRYALGVTGYNPLFQPYFDVVKPTLTKAVSFVLDGTDLYVLGSDGSVQKFDYQEAPQKFTMPKLATPLNHPTELFTQAGTNWVWIADPHNRRILQLDKSGAFVHSYVSGDPAMHFGALKSFTVGPAGNTIYVLADSRVFQFSVAR